MENTQRGYSRSDNRDFTGEGLENLKAAAQEMRYLLDRGYPVSVAATFIGNHRQLSVRQRAALSRAVCSAADEAARAAKRREPAALAGRTAHVDSFNAVITLEVALSGSPVLLCCDGTVRDLAGLRGTYRLIERTQTAVRMIMDALCNMGTTEAVFWLDAPVSNSGRLKGLMLRVAEERGLAARAELVGNADAALWDRDFVVSSDSGILGRCAGWVNLNGMLVPDIPGAWLVDIRPE